MKRMKIMVAFLAFFLSMGLLQAQDLDRATVKQLIESRNFVFKAQTALPQGRSAVQLTSDYDVRFSGDTLVTYLPYFGRAYTPILPHEGGLQFTSGDFDYKVKDRKKGMTEITVEPEDYRNVRSMVFSISENGYASLQVYSNNRQAISYQGYIQEKK